jgi:uncharacterized protein (DUF58 family)
MTVAERRREPLLPPEALTRLANVGLVARWVVEGFLQGLHASPHHGFSVEFAEYRPYTPGEDLRAFDWKALAKSDRLYVKRFHSETNLKAHLVLDCSASMGFTSGGPTKLRYGACLAAALAHLLVRQQDAVGLALFDERLRRCLPPRSSPRQRRDIVQFLEEVRPGAGTRTAAALHALAERIPRRGLIVLIGDLYDDAQELLRALRHFRYLRHEVIVFHLFDPAELALPWPGMSEFRDMESGERLQVLAPAWRAEYRRAVDEHVARWRRDCSDARIDYQVLDTSAPFDVALSAYLHRRSRLG